MDRASQLQDGELTAVSAVMTALSQFNTRVKFANNATAVIAEASTLCSHGRRGRPRDYTSSENGDTVLLSKFQMSSNSLQWPNVLHNVPDCSMMLWNASGYCRTLYTSMSRNALECSGMLQDAITL